MDQQNLGKDELSLGSQILQNKELELKLMLESGLHYGHKRTIFHPSMKPYVFGLKDGIYLINLDKTYDKFKEALDLLEEIKKNNKTVLFLSTLPHFKNIVADLTKSIKMPHITDRWVGGLFTNFEIVKQRIKKYINLSRDRAGGKWDILIKKEKVKLEKEFQKMDKKWCSLKDLEKLPDYLFVFNLRDNLIAVREAKNKNIKIIAIADTDSDISMVDYIIPANDNALNSISYIVSKIKKIFE